jgi:hypothetical protein
VKEEVNDRDLTIENGCCNATSGDVRLTLTGAITMRSKDNEEARRKELRVFIRFIVLNDGKIFLAFGREIVIRVGIGEVQNAIVKIPTLIHLCKTEDRPERIIW